MWRLPGNWQATWTWTWGSAFVVTASDGSLAISSNKFTVAGDTGNTVVAGTLDATGAATLSTLKRWMWQAAVDVNSGKFAVNGIGRVAGDFVSKFTVAGDTGNTVVAGTLNATGAATLSSTLDVAGDVDVNSGKFAVAASGQCMAISSNKFTVAGDTGNTVVAGTLNATGAATLSSTLDVAGRRGREQWEVCGDGIGRVAGDFVEQVHGGWQHGQHGGGGDVAGTLDVDDVDVNSGKFAVTAYGSLAISSNKFTVAGDSSGAATLSSTLDVAGDVDVNSGKFAVTASDGSLAISSNKFTVAGDTGNTVVAGTLDVTGAATLSSTLDVAGDVDVNSGKFAVTASDGSLAISSNKFTVAGNTGNTVVAGTLSCDVTGCGSDYEQLDASTGPELGGLSTLLDDCDQPKHSASIWTMDVAGASNLTSTTLLDDLEMSSRWR